MVYGWKRTYSESQKKIHGFSVSGMACVWLNTMQYRCKNHCQVFNTKNIILWSYLFLVKGETTWYILIYARGYKPKITESPKILIHPHRHVHPYQKSKGKATFTTTCLDLIVALPYIRYWWKSSQCPHSKVISLEIILMWLVVVTAIFINGTSCHVLKHFLHLNTNVKHTVWVQSCMTTAVNQHPLKRWNCCKGRTIPQKVGQNCLC